jgi:hypothetical protein
MNKLKVVKISKTKDLKKVSCQCVPFHLDLSNLNVKLIPSNFAQLNQYLRIVSVNSETKIIGDNAFEGCPILGIYDGYATIIGKRAFYFCQVLSGFPFSQVEEMDESAFQFSGIRDFRAGPKLKNISASCFADCYKLKSVDLGSVESIGHHSFDSCSFHTLTLPKTLTKIGNYAFQNCTYLENLVCLNREPPLICEKTFYGTTPNKIWVVDEKAANKYSAAKYWSDFKDNIQVLNIDELKKKVNELEKLDEKRLDTGGFIEI